MCLGSFGLAEVIGEGNVGRTRRKHMRGLCEEKCPVLKTWVSQSQEKESPNRKDRDKWVDRDDGKDSVLIDPGGGWISVFMTE